MKHPAEDVLTPAAPAKKARGNAGHAATVALVNSILANPKGYPISGNEEVVRKSLVNLASYARSLEQQLAGGSAAAATAGTSKAAAAVVARPAKSQAELEAAAEKLRKAAVSGIKKQMSVSGAHICMHVLPPTDTSLSSSCMCSGSLRARLALRSGPTMASAPILRSSACS